ncbi:hypothetical protein E2C01_022319 [Portunus trituberculatus]|uniref:Arrestin C-terminal-like domain-containing protein n=1 Tax=Portunus trituberculatus TaxID=210409 RepID=A0A5B7E540_PORTR|nr:hypothetical protein [Portunus trituberculatus]
MTCLSRGPVSCRVRLDRGGYVPGETISVWARVQNQSKVTIKKTRACLTEAPGMLAGRSEVGAANTSHSGGRVFPPPATAAAPFKTRCHFKFQDC